MSHDSQTGSRTVPASFEGAAILSVLRDAEPIRGMPDGMPACSQAQARSTRPASERARTAWRAYRHAARLRGPLFEPDLAPPGVAGLTPYERRLLRAVAVARTADAALLDNYTYRLALDRQLRACLVEAIRVLVVMAAECEPAAVGPSGPGSRP